VFAALLAGRDPEALLPPASGGEHHTRESGGGRHGRAGPGEAAGCGLGRPGLAGLTGSV